MTTVPTTEPASESDYYAEIADELLRIAEDLRKIGPGVPKPYFSIDIHPGTNLRGDDEIIAAVDQVAIALTGRSGTTRLMSDGNNRHHQVTNHPRGLLAISVYNAISTKGEADAAEAQRAKDAELVRLRAENERLRAAAPSFLDDGFVDDDPTGLGYSREADDPTPTSAVPATVEGHAEFSGRAAVPDVTLCLAEVEPATTCDEPIWWNAGANAWWHRSDEHFNHTATGPSVPPSADCGCPVRPFPEGRGDASDTIVEHRDGCPNGGCE